MKQAETISDLSKENLLQLTKIYAKNWLAHDGCWFLSVEKKFGMETAIEMDTESWRKFTIVEARRLIFFHQFHNFRRRLFANKLIKFLNVNFIFVFFLCIIHLS